MKKIIMSFLILASFNIFSANENIIRKISVTGNSEKEIIPDIAVINFQIVEKDKDLNTASKNIKKRLEDFKNSLKARKIQTGEIETLSYYDKKGIEYEQDYETLQDTKEKKIPISYTAQIEILVKDMDFNKIGEIIGFDGDKDLSKIEKNFEQNAYSVILQETDKNVNDALNKLITRVDDVKNKLQNSNIINNTAIFGGYKIKENYTQKNDEKVEIYYYVTQNLRLIVKNLKNLNTIISLADDNGININGSVQFDLSNKDEIEKQMYKQAYNEAENKAKSILKSSVLKLGEPIIVSEDLDFQQKMIDKIDSQWEVKVDSPKVITQTVTVPVVAETNTYYVSDSLAKSAVRTKVDYTPKPIKLEQNVSVMYEIK